MEMTKTQSESPPTVSQNLADPIIGRPESDHWQGDFGRGNHVRGGIYPQFRPMEQHIQYEILDGVREDMLMPDDAHALSNELRHIQYEELREYQVHGWNLPYGDQYRINAELMRLNRTVAETRNEP